ncbi:unnamed protein product [Blumeria hordei]|uniref:CAP-Gly domain-containing protein n=2 Tax=Blumeria hordei TaxID=2867405 RepID=A0A383UZC8_BLUHO|nr:Cell polarity protein alp11 [Blumeria hordei DH14]SZF04935.1 unnamed protein product [Blumeria hordei]
MALQSAGDVPLIIVSDNASSERRINPSWTIWQLKTKLEPITGIPPSSQQLTLKLGNKQCMTIANENEEATTLEQFHFSPYAEIHVIDLRPPGMRPNYSDPSQVPKFELPLDQYEQKTDSVLAWKKANNLGRFNPAAPSHDKQRRQAIETEIHDRQIEVGRRCRVSGEDSRRGVIMYIGEVDEIPDGGGKWIGIQLDEPVGRNDGSLGGKRYWGKDGDLKSGVFVRPQKVEVGQFPVLNDMFDEDMEEI